MTSGIKGSAGSSCTKCGSTKMHARGLCQKCYDKALRIGELVILQETKDYESRTTGRGRSLRDGRSDHYLYSTWQQMISRCSNPNACGYQYYGGRGITVCARWRADFWNFVDDMGDRPLGKSLERKNYNGNYTPANCEWADPKTQATNRRPRCKKVKA